MKPHIQKLPLEEDTSFVARTYCTPNFEVGWHQHQEVELILFTQGAGLGFVGDHISHFKAGDIYLLGSNLPHTFQKHDPKQVTSAVVVQFLEDFWGEAFLALPESRGIKALISQCANGLKIPTETSPILAQELSRLELSKGFERILILSQILHVITRLLPLETLSTVQPKLYSKKDQLTIERIYSYTLSNYRQKISLEQVANIANLSIPAFCSYFKRSTRKTFNEFLTQIRIANACSLLTTTALSIGEICMETGYNSEVNFHKQFLKLKFVSPLQYRKHMARLA